jgi:hypothetical protein
MSPSHAEIEKAAYDRWSRRGGRHGGHVADWLAAEQDLLFARNYEVVASYRLDDHVPQVLRRGRRVCRYCEQAPPRTGFAGPARAVPEALGNRSLFVDDECDECHALFAAAIDVETGAFAREVLAGTAPGGAFRIPPLPVAALKGLTRMALAILPDADLDAYADTVEWVLNPDHGLDRPVFAGLGLYLHVATTLFPSPWTALARRVADDEPMPAMLYLLGTAHLTFELAVPLGLRDEAHDAGGLVVPRVASVPGSAHAPAESTCLFVPVAQAAGASALASPAG